MNNSIRGCVSTYSWVESSNNLQIYRFNSSLLNNCEQRKGAYGLFESKFLQCYIECLTWDNRTVYSLYRCSFIFLLIFTMAQFIAVAQLERHATCRALNCRCGIVGAQLVRRAIVVRAIVGAQLSVRNCRLQLVRRSTCNARNCRRGIVGAELSARNL